jgi:hypothetical protein
VFTVAAYAGKAYSSSFPLTQAPISEAGAWHNSGLDWTLIDTQPGLAFGTQPGNGTTGTTQFSDSYALLSGFGTNHSITATVFIGTSINDGTQHEVEVFLRHTDSAHNAHGYECNFSVFGDYSTIVRWNGALADFTQLGPNPGVGRALVTNDVISAQIVGNIITTFFNGAVIQTCDITTFGGAVWTQGNPGIGTFRNNTGNGSFVITDVGFSSVVAKTIG